MRFGVVSARGRGAYLAQLYAKHPDTELVAVADLNPDAFAQGREQFPVENCEYREHPSATAMLANEDLDWVFVATADPLHYEVSREVLESGCNVFIEKPMCLTIEHADHLCRLQQKMGNQVVVGCELRHTVGALKLRELLRGGVIGQIVMGHCLETQARGHTYFRRPFRHMSYGSPPLMQKGIHLIDLLLSFVDTEPVRVFGSASLDVFGRDPAAVGKLCCDCDRADTCPYHPHTGIAIAQWKRDEIAENAPAPAAHCVFDGSIDVHDNTVLHIDFADGAKISVAEIYFAPDDRREFTFYGTKGRAHLSMISAPDPKTVLEIQQLYWQKPEIIELPRVEGGHEGGDPGLRDALVASTVSGSPSPRPNCQDARTGIAIIRTALQSIETGQPVDIPTRATE